MKARGRVVAIFLLAVSLSCLVGCSSIGSSVDLSAKVYSTFKDREASGHAVANFAKIVPGDWTQMTIVCGHASASVLNKALGLRWTEARVELSKFGFAGMVVFSDHSSVISYYNAGQYAFQESQFYFTPCDPPTAGPSRPMGDQLIAVSRADAVANLLLFRIQGNLPQWYISDAERARLSHGSR